MTQVNATKQEIVAINQLIKDLTAQKEQLEKRLLQEQRTLYPDIFVVTQSSGYYGNGWAYCTTLTKAREFIKQLWPHSELKVEAIEADKISSYNFDRLDEPLHGPEGPDNSFGDRHA
jgi:hypothetical protein